MDKSEVVKSTISVSGVVQGVGFRPFVARIARELGVAGTVQNVNGCVLIRAHAAREVIDQLCGDLRLKKPEGSFISALERSDEEVSDCGLIPEALTIIKSKNENAGNSEVMPPPDIAVCDECLGELLMPGNPRYKNPFISCTNCGPRFSIMKSAPYDRAATTMGDYIICENCAHDYADSDNRRCHVQTICCNTCGPTLFYSGRNFGAKGRDALECAIDSLRRGEILAVKGIGGYHLACSPFDARIVRWLRAIKGRESKPLAVMFPDIAHVKEYCELTYDEEKLLLSRERPIVLLKRKPSPVADEVFGSSKRLGAFLPYTPLHHLILRETGPLVMTSANLTSLPIIIRDNEMAAFFDEKPEISGILWHNREILRRLDDSVAAVVGGRRQLIRRARGFVPLAMPVCGDAELLACGAHEKSAFCLCRGGSAFLSTEIGDLGNVEMESVYKKTVSDMKDLLRISPQKVICDLHPGYFTTDYARSRELPVMQVQHHHAHIASVMAEHGLAEPVIGVAFDGTGWGSDGSIWGGEFLIVSPEGFSRAGNLKAIKMLNSEESVRQGWKSAACHLHSAGIDCGIPLIKAALENDVNTVPCSSMGRLFDAVSAMLGICRESEYGGQCAIELENAAESCPEIGRSETPLSFDLSEEDGKLIADLGSCIREIYTEHENGVDKRALAWRFHVTVCEMIFAMCRAISRKNGIKKIALSGGVFANRLILERICELLEQCGYNVYTNMQVPCGDGGIALGQAQIGLWEEAKGK